MKKRIVFLTVLALCLALTGCATRPSAPAAAEPPAATTAPAATAAPAETGTPEPPSTVPDPTPAPEKNGMYDLLSDMFDNYHFGTAGSTLTGARYAASIVDWGVTNGADAVRAGAGAWDKGLENEYGEKLADKLGSLYSMALSFYGAGTNVLSDCGWEGEWTCTGSDVHTVFRQIYSGLELNAPRMLRVYYPDSDVMYLLAQGVELPASAKDLTEDLNNGLSGLVLEGESRILSAELYDDGELRLDLNDAAAAQIRAYGTSGESLTIRSIVNTALEFVPAADRVSLTVNGGLLETGHNVYDYPMTFTEEQDG